MEIAAKKKQIKEVKEDFIEIKLSLYKIIFLKAQEYIRLGKILIAFIRYKTHPQKFTVYESQWTLDTIKRLTQSLKQA